jgi:hypothetical protein
MAINVKQIFRIFDESTSLQGYGYLLVAKSVMAQLFLVLVIIVMTCIGMEFMIQNTKEYMNSKLITNIESSTAPL